MADIIRTTTEVFANTYEVKNGQIGSQDVLNFAVHKLKLELNDLWNWAAGEDTTVLEDGGLAKFLIDDRAFQEIVDDNVDVTTKVRSVSWIENNILEKGDTARDNNATTTKSWHREHITYNIQNNTVSGGTWDPVTP